MSDTRNPTFFLLTDFGAESIYTGQLRGVLKRMHPAGEVHTLSNRVPRQNPVAAGFYLQSSLPYLPEGAGVLCVVDPGVGTDRPIVAVETREPELTLVGPDNGMFAPLEPRVESCARITNDDLWLEDVSNTFHGRDIMAPTLAHLVDDVNLPSVGPEHRDLRQPDPPDIYEPKMQHERIRGKFLFADSFGNLISNISRSDLEQSFDPDRFDDLRIHTKRIELHGLSTSYGDVEPGTPIALIGSAGQLEISVNQDSAREVLDLDTGDRITVE